MNLGPMIALLLLLSLAVLICHLIDRLWPLPDQQNRDTLGRTRRGFQVISDTMPFDPAAALSFNPLDDGPGTYRVYGVPRNADTYTVLRIDADSMADAKLLAEREGMIVKAIDKEPLEYNPLEPR